MTDSYVFAAAPRPVQVEHATTRPKYREPVNIMVDKRVVRGSTYASHPQLDLTVVPPPRNTLPRPDSAMRRRLWGFKEKAPPPPTHLTQEVQTDSYLEELVDHITEHEQASQTEHDANYILNEEDEERQEKLRRGQFIAKPHGVDKGTIIEDGALFVFDIGVEPLLEVIVGKALDQAHIEVLEEEEMKALEAQRLKFQHERNAVLAETQRLEEEARRRFEEKERRLVQARERAARQKELREKALAATVAAHTLAQLNDQVVSSLTEQGAFVDRTRSEVESIFLPWIVEQASTLLDRRRESLLMARGLIDQGVQAVSEEKRKAEADRIEQARKKREEEARRLREEEELRVRLAEEARLEAERKAAAEAEAAAAAARAEEDAGGDGEAAADDDEDEEESD